MLVKLFVDFDQKYYLFFIDEVQDSVALEWHLTKFLGFNIAGKPVLPTEILVALK